MKQNRIEIKICIIVAVLVILLYLPTIVRCDESASDIKIIELALYQRLRAVKMELLDEKIQHKATMEQLLAIQFKYNIQIEGMVQLNIRLEQQANELTLLINNIQLEYNELYLMPFRQYDIYMQVGMYIGTGGIITYRAGMFLYQGLSLELSVTGFYDYLYLKVPGAFAGVGMNYKFYWRWQE